MNPIIKILMERDGLTEQAANEQLSDARAYFYTGEVDIDEVLLDELGLEPDYIFDFLEN